MSLEYIYKDLYSQTEYIASQWSGATSNRFYQMFNDTKRMMFNVLQELGEIEEEQERAAIKFPEAGELYGGNLVGSDIQEGAMCGKLPPKSEETFWDRNKKDLSDVWTGISTGFVDGVGDKETWLNMKDAIVNYEETIPAAWNALSDSFMNEFWNGNLKSREHYAAFAITSILTGFVGGNRTSRKGSVLQRGKSLLTNSSAYRKALHILNNYEFKAGNHLSVHNNTYKKQLHIPMNVQLVRRQLD